MNESVEDRRNVVESRRSRLRNESSTESEVDRRLGREGEGSERSSGTDVGRTEEILETDLGELDSDGRRVGERRGEGEGDSTGGVVGGEIEAFDDD